MKQAIDWLLARNVTTVVIGDLTDVLSTHWCAEVNEKTHQFWAHHQLVARLQLTGGDTGITVTEHSEAESSSVCPACGSVETTRAGDAFSCHECQMDEHSDVVGAWNLLQSASEGGPMARPAAPSAGRDGDAPVERAYWEWNDHEWTPQGERSRSLDQTSLSKPASSQPG